MLIPTEIVGDVWHLGAPFLQRAEEAASNEFALSEWRADAEAGRAQLWFLWSDGDTCEGAGVTHLIATPHGKVCRITAFGANNGGLWRQPLQDVEAWAKAQGCKIVRVYGRIGWADQLKGYAIKGVILDRGL